MESNSNEEKRPHPMNPFHWLNKPSVEELINFAYRALDSIPVADIKLMERVLKFFVVKEGVNCSQCAGVGVVAGVDCGNCFGKGYLGDTLSLIREHVYLINKIVFNNPFVEMTNIATEDGDLIYQERMALTELVIAYRKFMNSITPRIVANQVNKPEYHWSRIDNFEGNQHTTTWCDGKRHIVINSSIDPNDTEPIEINSNDYLVLTNVDHDSPNCRKRD